MQSLRWGFARGCSRELAMCSARRRQVNRRFDCTARTAKKVHQIYSYLGLARSATGTHGNAKTNANTPQTIEHTHQTHLAHTHAFSRSLSAIGRHICCLEREIYTALLAESRCLRTSLASASSALAAPPM